MSDFRNKTEMSAYVLHVGELGLLVLSDVRTAGQILERGWGRVRDGVGAYFKSFLLQQPEPVLAKEYLGGWMQHGCRCLCLLPDPAGLCWQVCSHRAFHPSCLIIPTSSYLFRHPLLWRKGKLSGLEYRIKIAI